MKHFWKKSTNNFPISVKLDRATTLTGQACGSTYKIETLEYESGKVTSVLFVAADDAVIGKNMLQISYDDGRIRVTSSEDIQPPVVASGDDAAEVLRSFVQDYAEDLMFDYENDDFDYDSIPTRGKHVRAA